MAPRAIHQLGIPYRMDQKVEALNSDDVANLEAKRKWVREHYDETARDKYETLDGKLRLLDTILRSKWIAANETLKLQCLGVITNTPGITTR